MSLIDKLGDPDPEVREDALISLSVKDAPTDEELRALAGLLHDDRARIREVAADALYHGRWRAWQSERLGSALPADLLLPALADRSAEVRQYVLRILLNYRTDDRIRAAVVVLLDDPVSLVRVRAAAVVWSQTRNESLILPVLNAAIRSGERDAVIHGCHLLIRLGPAAGDVVPLVWDYLRHADGAVRGNAACTVLKCCRDRRVLAEAAELVKDQTGDSLGDALVRYAAYKLREAAEAEPSVALDGPA